MTFIVTAERPGVGRIGYKNIFNNVGATVTASSEATGFAKENAYDYFGYDWWKPTTTGVSWLRASFASATNANYMAIWGHDLGTQGSNVKPQYSTSGGAIWVDAASVNSPSNNNVLFFSWDTKTAADWRILVTNPTTIASIAGVQIGEALIMDHNMEIGYAPESLAPVIESKTAQSESGAFIGGSQLHKGIKGSINLTNIDPVWVRSEWQPFINHAQTPKPFVWVWDSVTHPTEIVLGWVSGQIQAPRYSSSLYMDISLNFEGTL